MRAEDEGTRDARGEALDAEIAALICRHCGAPRSVHLGGAYCPTRHTFEPTPILAECVGCGERFPEGYDHTESDCTPASPPSPAAAPEIAKLDEIAALRHGWDSYNAHCIDPRAIESARHLLAAFAHPPAIVPTTNGGIQLEWHTHDVDVELAITPSGGRDFSLLSDDDDELESQVRTLQEENEAMREDAKRLDFLEARSFYGVVDIEIRPGHSYRIPLTRSAIDRARVRVIEASRAALSSKMETAE